MGVKHEKNSDVVITGLSVQIAMAEKMLYEKTRHAVTGANDEDAAGNMNNQTRFSTKRNDQLQKPEGSNDFLSREQQLPESQSMTSAAGNASTSKPRANGTTQLKADKPAGVHGSSYTNQRNPSTNQDTGASDDMGIDVEHKHSTTDTAHQFKPGDGPTSAGEFSKNAELANKRERELAVDAKMVPQHNEHEKQRNVQDQTEPNDGNNVTPRPTRASSDITSGSQADNTQFDAAKEGRREPNAVKTKDGDSSKFGTLLPEFPPGTEHYTSSDGDHIVSIYKADITTVSVESIVSASGAYLYNHTQPGVSRAISKAVSGMVADCRHIMNQRRRHPILDEEVEVTSGGTLCKKTIHAVGPTKAYSQDGVLQCLQMSFLNCLYAAEEMKLRSIAIPAIGSGKWIVS